MKVKLIIELTVDLGEEYFDTTDDWFDPFTQRSLTEPIDKLRWLASEEGFFGLFDIGNDEFANSIKSIGVVE